MFVDTLPPTLKALSEFVTSYSTKIDFYNLFSNARLLQQLTLSNIVVNPSSGSTVQIPDKDQSAWIEVVVSGTLSTLSIAFPTNSSCIDSQEVLITSNNTITTLTLIAPNSSFSVVVVALAANTAIRYKYSKASNIWYKI